jgi:hypothetical protein
VTKLVLDPAASRIRVQTFAEGLFARLAHDLELACGSLSGAASREEATATVEVPLAGIAVGGVLRDGAVDVHALSAGDRREILEKMRRDVFRAQGEDARVRVESTLDGAGGTARLRIMTPNGRTTETTTRPVVRDEAGAAPVRVTGSLELSLSAIGSDVVKGPMNAFRVTDTVRVHYDLSFVVSPP